MQTPTAFHPWEETIARSQHAFNKLDVDQCISLNLDALSQIKPLFEEYFNSHADLAMAAIMVTYMNLASAFFATENYRAGNKALNEASRLIQTVCESQDLSEAQQVAVLRAAYQLRIAWADHQKQGESRDLDTYLTHQAPPMVLSLGGAPSAQLH